MYEIQWFVTKVEYCGNMIYFSKHMKLIELLGGRCITK